MISLKEVLPIIEVLVNENKHLALVESGCSQSFVTESVPEMFSKSMVCPVLDFCRLNEYVDTYTANADI